MMAEAYPPILPSAVLLAGGRSTRLGRDKALEQIGGRSLLDWALTALDRVAGEIIVVIGHGPSAGSGHGQDWQPTCPHPLMQVVKDLMPDRGPLMGLYTGLSAAHSPYVWVMGCDMPFLDPALLQYLMAQAAGHEAVVPRVAGQNHPLHAVYGQASLPAVKAQLKEDDASLYHLLECLKVRYVEETEASGPEAWRRSCFNINTEADLILARSIAEAL